MAINKVHISEKALSVVALILAAISISLSIFFYEQAVRSERETRMLQYYLLELDAKVIAAGIKKPEEAISKQQEKRP